MHANQYIREVEVKFKTKPTPDQLVKIGNPDDVVKFFTDLQDETQEKIIAIYLDTKSTISCFQIVSIGTLNSAPIEPKDILKTSLLTNSYGLILVHNHPSGDPKPSPEDTTACQALKAACKILNIQLMDFIIIGDNGMYFSFKAKGFIK